MHQVSRGMSARPLRAAIYARYSSDLQRDASIEDQVAVCRRFCEMKGWQVGEIYADRAVSGADANRPNFQRLQSDATKGRFDVVVAESIDRLARQLSAVGGLLDNLSFHRIRLYTTCNDEISPLMAGILGSIGQHFLEDLKHKTRRGMLGKVLSGLSAGGLGYGYRAVDGAKGQREINEAEAEIVRRVFREYAGGQSARNIAARLNSEGIPGPNGRQWGDTTIRGQVARGTGLINNALYVGRLEWNRCSYVKDPRTGKRQARPNPPEEWEIFEVPALRIIDDELWRRAKARQDEVRTEMGRDEDGHALNRAHRRKFLLSGLIECGECGSPFVMVDYYRYGCNRHRSKGTCGNDLKVAREEIEERLLGALRERLMEPERVTAFLQVSQKALEEQAKSSDRERAALERRLQDVKRRRGNIMRAIEDGLYRPEMKEKMRALDDEEQAVEREMKAVVTDPALPSSETLVQMYRISLEHMLEMFDPTAYPNGPGETLRGMIDKIVLTPNRARTALEAGLHGSFAGVLAMMGVGEEEAAEDDADAKKRQALETKQPSEVSEGCSTSVVAGARFISVYKGLTPVLRSAENRQ